MTDTTVKKVDADHSPAGELGQRYLASGKAVSMRLWDRLRPGTEREAKRSPYEVVGYVIAGRAELFVEDQRVTLDQGDSWVVPRDAEHAYRIVEEFTAVEATAPPARTKGRDLE